MKFFNLIMALLVVNTTAFASSKSTANDSTGNAGDDLDLQGVLSLFQQAQNLEEFEKAINTESNGVNNLDLNKDGEIDYIKVLDKVDSGAHAIVLQVPVSEKESQDVAVIEIEKKDAETAYLQIVGNEDIYGDDYIYEPFQNYVTKEEYDATNENEGGQAKKRVVVNVYTWPAVRYVYAPGYVVWTSPWRWHYYPGWWKPWRPLGWHAYHRHMVRYHAHWHRVYAHKTYVAHRAYNRHRVYSPTVRTTHPVKSAQHRPQPKTHNQTREHKNIAPKNQPKQKMNTPKPGRRKPAGKRGHR